MTDDERKLSAQIDQARDFEEYYREMLLFWKRRRQRLEQRIPLTGIFKEVEIILGEVSNDDNWGSIDQSRH